MKTDIYTITGDKSDLTEIQNQIRKAAAYNSLSEKDTIRLELIGEELLGLEKGILGLTVGEFHIETDKKSYHLCLHALVNLDIDTQEEFVNMSKNQKNEAYKGFKGKMRLIMDTFLYTPSGAELAEFDSYIVSGASISAFSPANYDMTWMFSEYKNSLKSATPEWDELEHSILANVADDIVVGTRNNSVDIVVTKKFD